MSQGWQRNEIILIELLPSIGCFYKHYLIDSLAVILQGLYHYLNLTNQLEPRGSATFSAEQIEPAKSLHLKPEWNWNPFIKQVKKKAGDSKAKFIDKNGID